MRRLVIYDISDSKLREKVSSMFADYGFIRIQKSAMIAEINPRHLAYLKIQLKRIKLQSNDDIMILSLCRDCERDIFSVNSRVLPRKVSVVVY
ncbi:MAG: CRISPR-associated endonuclease Cas2 [Nitrososphaerota archaeon]